MKRRRLEHRRLLDLTLGSFIMLLIKRRLYLNHMNHLNNKRKKRKNQQREKKKMGHLLRVKLWLRA